MSELDQLKNRINNSESEGIETAVIRDDYEPAGAMMIKTLCDSGNYVQRKTPMHSFGAKWRIFQKGFEPY